MLNATRPHRCIQMIQPFRSVVSYGSSLVNHVDLDVNTRSAAGACVTAE